MLIEKLTPEQEALMPAYREKWKAIAFSTKPINHQKLKEAVKAAYATLKLKEPDILFFDSPYAALDAVLSQLSQRSSQRSIPLWLILSTRLKIQLSSQLSSQLETPVSNQLCIQLQSELESQLYIPESNQLRSQLRSQLSSQLASLSMSILSDFCISVLNYTHDQMTWSALELLFSECGQIFPYEKTCFVCDRPRQLRFDSQERLHAEGEPAIEFADGYSLYSYHGVTLPEKYGKLYPKEWQAQWLLEEKNAELRRVLIQEIGYAGICQELQATELDSWQEYSLLRIKKVIDREPIYLLKMTCPSTGFIHAMRVPPDMTSAREAIRWVNWGIDPANFSVQT